MQSWHSKLVTAGTPTYYLQSKIDLQTAGSTLLWFTKMLSHTSVLFGAVAVVDDLRYWRA
jgi:hypothetical protein